MRSERGGNRPSSPRNGRLGIWDWGRILGLLKGALSDSGRLGTLGRRPDSEAFVAVCDVAGESEIRGCEGSSTSV
jgi:hypothetical protein